MYPLALVCIIALSLSVKTTAISRDLFNWGRLSRVSYIPGLPNHNLTSRALETVNLEVMGSSPIRRASQSPVYKTLIKGVTLPRGSAPNPYRFSCGGPPVFGEIRWTSHSPLTRLPSHTKVTQAKLPGRCQGFEPCTTCPDQQ